MTEDFLETVEEYETLKEQGYTEEEIKKKL